MTGRDLQLQAFNFKPCNFKPFNAVPLEPRDAERELGTLSGFAQRISGGGAGDAALPTDGETILVDEA